MSTPADNESLVNVILRANGKVEHLPTRPTLEQINELIDARHACDSFRLPGGLRCWVIDDGHQRGLPFNREATRLYRSICRPGTTHYIVGDAVVVKERGGDY
jgi:hypothetical protein